MTEPTWNHAPDAEQSVIGGLLVDNSTLDKIADILRPEDFFTRDHRIIFRAIEALIFDNHPADALTVMDMIRRDGHESSEVSQAYLAEVAINCPSAANIRRYAEIVRDRAVLRKLAAAGTSIVESAIESHGKGVRELLDSAQAQVVSILDKNAAVATEFTATPQLLTGAIEYIDAQYKRHAAGLSTDLSGISTGFVDLDRITSGFQPGQLIVLAARPSMGKSAFALNLAEAAAAHEDKAAPFFSMEMSKHELGLRLLASSAGVNMQRLATGRIREHEWDRITQAAGKLNTMPILINESGALTVLELSSMARRAFREHHGLSMIVVDYIQLMAGSDHRANREAQIAEISRGLKKLAKELQVPVLALSQLNRSLESRTNKRPMMSDLRESGAIEQDADVILFIYRDEVYNPDTPDRGVAEIIVAKQRNGPVGVVKLVFRADHTRFVNMSATEKY